MAVSVRKSSEVESHMTSIERVNTYTKIENEPGYKVEQAPPENWPLERNIKGGTDVEGRTGAGKSSLVAALQRMPEAQGVLMIDNVPIKGISLQKTRRCISALDQNPVHFSGSLKKNLDLMEQFVIKITASP